MMGCTFQRGHASAETLRRSVQMILGMSEQFLHDNDSPKPREFVVHVCVCHETDSIFVIIILVIGKYRFVLKIKFISR